MPAAFEFCDYLWWGSNGMLESYLERLCELAAGDTGCDPRLRLWLEAEREGFYSGTVIRLDRVLGESGVIGQFLAYFDRATTEFLNGDDWAEAGREWLRLEAPKLHAHLAKAVV